MTSMIPDDRQSSSGAPETTGGTGRDSPSGQSHGRDAPSERARHLAQLCVRIEKFLQVQLERLDAALAGCREALARGEAADALLNELQEKQQEWEQKRRREAREIHEERQRLAEAWERMESEQRELIAERESLRFTQQGGAETTSPVGAGLGASGEFSQQAAAEPGTSWNADDILSTGQASELARRQFQQLKREIRKHAQRSPRSK